MIAGDGELMVECVSAGADVLACYPVVEGKLGFNATVLHVAARYASQIKLEKGCAEVSMWFWFPN